MSTLKVNNITDTSGGSSNLEVPGAAKAWVNFNGTGTVAIRSDLNVSSITDNANGDYTVNFTTAMSDTNYCVVGGMSANSSGSNGNTFYSSTQTSGPAYNSGYTTTSSIRMLSMDGTGTNRDAAHLNVAVFAD
jgi:hypothetical protein|tara:strand:- start:198 stop:596 length:399 start_codon:yes stop_codon:yes gene_type:complete